MADYNGVTIPKLPTKALATTDYFIITDTNGASGKALASDLMDQVAEQINDEIQGIQEVVDDIYDQFASKDEIGFYNAETNLATIRNTEGADITFTPTTTPSIANGKSLRVEVPGTQSITGTAKEMVEGGSIISRGGAKWDYMSPPDTGYKNSINNAKNSARQNIIENMITQSESMSTFTAALATTESSALSPDGISSSLKFIESATIGVHRLTSPTFVFASGKSYTVAVAIAKGTRTRVRIELAGSIFGGGTPSLIVDLDAGSLSGITAYIKNSGIISLENEFYLVWFTVKTTGAATSSLRVDSYNGSTNSFLGDGSYFFISKPQLTQTEALTPYTATSLNAVAKSISVLVNNAEKLDWGARVRKNELDSKASATIGNMITYSEDLSNAAWTKVGIQAFSPVFGGEDTSENAWNVVENTSTEEHAVKSNAITITTGLTYYVSFDIKLISGTKNIKIVLGGSSLGSDSTMTINPVTKALSGGDIWADRGVIELDNGWFRVWGRTNAAVGTGASQLRIYSGTNASTLGDGTSGFYISRCQILNSLVYPRYTKTLGVAIAKSTITLVSDAEKATWNSKADSATLDARAPAFSESNMRLIFPGRLYLIDGKPLPIYRKSIISSLTGLDTFSLAIMERDNSNNNIPANRYFQEHILVDSAALLPSVEIVMIPKVSNNNVYRRPLTITRRTAASVSGIAVKINAFGDSLSQWGVISRTKLYLERLGAIPTMIGTLDTTAPIVKGEGRAGWSFKRFIGASSRMADNTVITIGNSSLITNPFLKLATTDDKTNFPDWCFRNTGAETELSYTADADKTGNFYIFDYAYYLSNNSLSTPDVVTIALSTNDIAHYGQVLGTQWSVFGLDIIVRQIKAAAPNMKIIIVPAPVRGYGSIGNPHWTNHFEFMERSLGIVAGYQSLFNNMHLCGVWAHMSRELDFVFNSGSALSANNPTLVSQIADQTHLDNSGTCEYANALSMCIANII